MGDARFADLQAKCSKLVATEDSSSLIADIIEEAEDFVVQLADVQDFVEPCFPPSYKIFLFIFRQYHDQLNYMLVCVGHCAEQLANADILKVRCRTPGQF